MMEAKKIKIVGAVVAVLLVVVFINVLWFSLGVCKTFFVLAGIGVALILGIVVWIVIKYSSSDDEASTTTVLKQPAALVEGEELRLQYSFLRKVTGLPTRFHYEALEAATDKFRVLIGRGSSASVFKGVLDGGTPVAVKRVEDSDHSDRVFRSEVAAIGRAQHANLVHLLGYCIVPRSRVRLLVYEFVDNGSLDTWIFPAKGSKPEQQRKCLPWALRCRAAVDVARALAYLHQDCRSRVLHLDVKPENILLDGGFRALVADFGLSKVMGRDESRVVTTVRGTRGYLAPEWIVGGGASEKSDVFSYGIVLLEMVGGRRSIRLAAGEGKWSYLPRIAAEKVRQGRVMEVVDERLVRAAGEVVEESEVRKLVYVALWCIREETKLRPSMAQVVDMLQGRMEVEAPPPEGDMLILDLLNMEYMSSATVAAAAAAAGGRAAAGGPRQLDSPTLGASGYFCSTSILSGR